MCVKKTLIVYVYVYLSISIPLTTESDDYRQILHYSHRCYFNRVCNWNYVTVTVDIFQERLLE